MQMRHFLLTSAASVGLFLTASHAPQALAQKGVFLSPSSQWAVTKVAGNMAAGQAGYCAVAKRYEGDAILTIARNQGTETSFALDLQKPIFNMASPMKVTLDPGAGEQRKYSVSPASQQAFVVRLGRDEAFFNAIDRTGMLRVEVADNSYVFNISDIDAGQSKLNTCLAAAVQPAAGEVSAPVPVKVDNSGVVAKLNARIRSLESQNNSLQAKIVDVEREALSVSASAAASPSSSQDAAPENTLRVEVLRAKNLELKAALQAGEVELRDDRLTLLEAENARLSQKLLDEADVSAQITQLQSRVASLLDENARLKDVQTGLSRAEISSFEGNIKALQSENQSLKVSLAAQAEKADVAQKLRAQIKQVEDENRSLKEQASVDKQASLILNQKKIADIQDQHLGEVAALRSQIDDLRLAQSNAAAQDTQDMDALSEQLASLRADNSSLKKELHDKQVLEEAERVDVAALEQENEALQLALDKAHDVTALQDQAIAVLEGKNGSLKEQLEAVHVDVASVDDLEGQLDKLNKALADSQAAQDEQQGKVLALMSENTDLRASLDAKVSENLSLARAMDDVSALKKEIASKDEKLASFASVPKRLQSLLDVYKSTKAEVAKLEHENSLMRGAQDENAGLVARLAEAQALNETFEAKLAAFEDNVVAMSQLNDEVKGLKVALADKEAKIQELGSLHEELSQVVAENTALKEKAMTLAALNEDAKINDEAKIQELGSLHEKLSQVVAENAALNDKTMMLAALNEDAKVQAHDDLSKENVALRQSLSSVIDKAEGQSVIIKAQKDAVDSVMAQNEALKAQLDMAAQMNVADAGAAALKAKTVSRKVAARQAVEPEAKVILASVSSAEVPKPRVKPTVVKAQKVAQKEVSFAETLAQMEPAAGGDDVEDVVVEEKIAQAQVIEAPEIVEEAQDFMERDLNQAQIYEEQLKRGLKNKGVVAQSREELIDVEVLDDVVPDEAGIDAVIDRVAAPEELPALEDDAVDVVQKGAEQAQENVADVLEITQPEDVEIKMSQDPFEGIAVEGEGVARDVAAAVQEVADDAAPMAAMPKAVKQPKSSPVVIDHAVAASDENVGGDAVARVLSRANIAGLSNVSAIADKGDAYQWRVGGLYGSGEQRMISTPAQFDEYVKDYLVKTEARCPGDFAIVPDDSKGSGAMRVDSYEIACVGDNVSSSASLVFYNQGGRFTVLAHEASADKMGEAMAVRDRIFASLASGRDS